MERHTTPIIEKMTAELRALQNDQFVQAAGLNQVIEDKLKLLENRMHEMRHFYELELYEVVAKANLLAIENSQLKAGLPQV